MAENSAEVNAQVYIIDGKPMSLKELMAHQEEAAASSARADADYKTMIADDAKTRAKNNAAYAESQRLEKISLQRAETEAQSLTNWSESDIDELSQISEEDIQRASKNSVAKLRDLNTARKEASSEARNAAAVATSSARP